MGTITHPFVSAIADGGDPTLVQPSNWNAGHTYDLPELNSVPTRLYLSGSTRLEIRGLGELVLGSTMPIGTTYFGVPKTPTFSFGVRDGYVFDLIGRLSLLGGMRATLEGTADIIISDDFKTRSRIVLAGQATS